ncbi:MAG: hypothetical protein ACXIUM_00520 [Wenzhouxiangella sp.]
MKEKAGNSPKTAVDAGRRRLMVSAIGAGAAVGIGAVSLNAQAAPAPQPAPAAKQTGYRETDHIRRYYRSAQDD